jgi:hypothetical protein
MNKVVVQIANIITSLGTVIFVLLMTVVAMIFLGHGLYYQVFQKCMPSWQADVASWVLSFGVETTVLVITCNVKYFSSRQLPIFFAICSGFIVLFFINAFDFAQPTLAIAIRWFIGLIVSALNFVYSELFVKKFSDVQFTADLLGQTQKLIQQNSEYDHERAQLKLDLASSKKDVEMLAAYVTELEAFKKKEIDKVTCKACKTVFPTIFHLNNHLKNCSSNPKVFKETIILPRTLNNFSKTPSK